MYALTAKVLCGSGDFSFTCILFPGTYEVRVEGSDYSNIPRESVMVVPQLLVQ